MVRVGVLAVQGDFLEHVEMLREMGVEVRLVKRREDLHGVDGLIIPGGESTTIGRLVEIRGLGPAIADLADRGAFVVGVCAGSILLARRVADRVVGETGQYTLGLMNISVVRNIFGRQRDSFVAEVELEGVGRVRGAFIRAPGIVEAWEPARIVGYVDHPRTGRVGCAALQGNLAAITFHPEITGDRRFYEYVLSRARR